MKIYVIGENTKSQTREADEDGDEGSCQQCDVRYGCRIERKGESKLDFPEF